ncbi:MAG: LLM class F420-dependent oxidoreductase [Deltaproteobacteria bacterium]|nr:LLM class F420-dependent oxidoreductase [Deltaproteobacteria bacterium]
MKFGLMYSNVGPFAQPEGLVHLAQTAERVGVESLWTVEHVAVPIGYESKYPYSENGRMPGPENAPIPDPIVWLSYAAAVTKKIKLATGILILPQRHPIYTAKQFATLDVLSKGRAIAGIGIGWLREEFEALGIPFAERAGRTEECARALRQLWSPDAKPFDGRYYQWGAIESQPKPVQPGGIPIVVGGHVEGAARRAARVGDGFFPAAGDFPTLFAAVRDECEKIGRNPDEIELTAGGPVRSLDDLKRYQDLGISRLIIPPPGFDPDALEAGLEKLGNDILSKL